MSQLRRVFLIRIQDTKLLEVLVNIPHEFSAWVNSTTVVLDAVLATVEKEMEAILAHAQKHHNASQASAGFRVDAKDDGSGIMLIEKSCCAIKFKLALGTRTDRYVVAGNVSSIFPYRLIVTIFPYDYVFS